MQLDQLIHWRLEGTPDVFTETRDGEEWRVIHTGGNQGHHGGFLQTVTFERPIKSLSLSVIATLHTAGGGLMLRLGIDPGGGVAPLGPSVLWSGWYGPDNGWSGQKAQVLWHHVVDLNTEQVTVFLESSAKWRTSNTSRWRDAQLEVEYAGSDPEPDPEPDPESGLAGQIAEIQAEITEGLAQISVQVAEIDALLAEWTEGQAWIDSYNSREVE